MSSPPSGPLPRRFVARARPPRRVGEAPTRNRGRACPDQRVGAHTQIFEEYRPEATRDIVERVLYEIDAVVMGVRFLGRRAARTAAPSSCVGPAVDDGVAASSCRVEDAHRSQAVGHLLGEPALDCGCLGELGGVEELGQAGREQAGGLVGASDPDGLLDRDKPAAGDDPAAPSERPPLSVDAELVLVGEEQLEFEVRVAEQRGDADEPREDVLHPSAPR